MSKRKTVDPRYSKNISLSDALSVFAKENKLDKKFEALKISELFMNCIPESSRKHILKVDYSNSIISVKVDSASLRQNLHMASSSLCDIINEKLDATIVHKILLS